MRSSLSALARTLKNYKVSLGIETGQGKEISPQLVLFCICVE